MLQLGIHPRRCWFVLPRYPTVFGASKQSGLDSGGDPAAVVLSQGGRPTERRGVPRYNTSIINMLYPAYYMSV